MFYVVLGPLSRQRNCSLLKVDFGPSQIGNLAAAGGNARDRRNVIGLQRMLHAQEEAQSQNCKHRSRFLPQPVPAHREDRIPRGGHLELQHSFQTGTTPFVRMTPLAATLTAAFSFTGASPAAAEIFCPRVALDAGIGIGHAKAPLVVSREIRRPARTLQAYRAAWIGKRAAHLVEGGL